MPKNNAKRIQRVGWVVEAGDQNVMVGAWSSSSLIISWSIIHILVGYHSRFGLLPQPLNPLSGFFLYCPQAFLSIVTQHFEWPFTTGGACNLLECLFLHCLHPYSSPHDPCYPLQFWAFITFLWGQLWDLYTSAAVWNHLVSLPVKSLPYLSSPL